MDQMIIYKMGIMDVDSNLQTIEFVLINRVRI